MNSLAAQPNAAAAMFVPSGFMMQYPIRKSAGMFWLSFRLLL